MKNKQQRGSYYGDGSKSNTKSFRSREIAILQLSYETSIEFPGVIYRWKQQLYESSRAKDRRRSYCSFRTARENAEHVFLCVNGEKKEMQIASKTERFDFYESSFFMGTEIADYYFEIHSEVPAVISTRKALQEI